MNMNVKPTKERLYLEHANFHGLETVERHFNRYRWAMSKLDREDYVLDAGCGSGYGDSILLQACNEVVGVDRSEEAISYARAKAGEAKNSRIRYVLQPLEELDLKTVFDACVCIEVIEHLSLDNQRRFLTRLTSLLVPNGRLYITTPIAGTNDVIQFHEHEHSKDSFLSLLNDFFGYVTLDDPTKFKVQDRFMLACCLGPILKGAPLS